MASFNELEMNIIMRYLLYWGIILWGLTACNGNNDAVQNDLDSKRRQLAEKREQANRLNREIMELEDAIEQLAPTTDRHRLVTTLIPEPGPFTRFAAVQAKVAAQDLISASAEMPGRVIALNVREGQQISRGNLIARIDTEQIDNQIAELETALELATTLYERQSNLWERQIGSEIQLLELRNNKERLEKNLANLQLQKERSSVYAPINGVVENVLIKQGEMAQPGSPIVQILDMNNLKVVASVPEVYLGKVKRGDRVRIEFPTIRREIEAPVTLIGNVINPANRTFNVEIAVDARQTVIKPNLTAVVHIEEYNRDEVILLPEQVIRREVSGRNYVFVADRTNAIPVARKKYVETGRSYMGDIVVETGLSSDDEVIVKGARELKDGEPVNISNEAENE